MRHARRLKREADKIISGITLGLCFTLSGCSLPDCSVEKSQKRVENGGAGFFTRTDDHGIATQQASNKSYLATVRLRFSDNSAPVKFDIHRDRRDLIAINMAETEHSATYLHLGYSHDEGGIAGLRFSFHF